MREIKFRAWDKITKQYYAVKGLEYDDGNLDEVYLAGLKISESNPVFNLRKPSDVILEQSTGLKDKNCKEIYEGDIVDDGYSLICEIRWSEHFTAFEAINENDGYVSNIWFVAKYGEVIGNIHENKELLKEKNEH